ncbi:conserved hypothetical protein [Candidatus Desulfarcum epimagneticum]|uniref:NYN domain-containing protein n=1 Tax=uncultured Desulfobacteraceae bacterium TaxID=218296 RepID=A0A484HDK5_9BACT|nr:conserved hypothetical protein [uncultured Desulfobacteraceae bacterium]
MPNKLLHLKAAARLRSPFEAGENSGRKILKGITMKSAIFVDFDNIYIRLKEQDENLASSFAKKPSQWLSWIEESLEGHSSNNPTRRVLVRRCYLNPKTFGDYRPYFIRSAFETIDCPSLTTQGKNSADIHMILDIMDLIKHETNFDEFIILSADADFTPVLLRLRKWDKRTTILSIGPSSSAYRAVADVVIDQDQFCEEALSDLNFDTQPVRNEPSAVQAAGPDECGKLIVNRVAQSNKPVSMATIASAIRRTFPDIADGWGGYDSFKKYVNTLNLEGLSISNVTPGYIFDPKRHNTPKASAQIKCDENFKSERPDLEPLAQKISDLTDTPYFPPNHYKMLFNKIATEVNLNKYHFTYTSKAVRDACKEAGIRIGRQHINFILRGITFGGHDFKENNTEDVISKAFVKNTITLCAKAQINLNEDDINLIVSWFS